MAYLLYDSDMPMSKMVYAICTRYWEGWRTSVGSWNDHATTEHPYILIPNMPIPRCFQLAYEGTTEPIIAYIHDDLLIHEPRWDECVLAEFDDPTVGLVGFAGALGHGHPNLYKVPYHLPNLARQQFRSNMTDAERHGGRITGAIDVAILDGLALFVRRSVLDTWGGWPNNPNVGYYLYAEHLCCEVRRQGLRIRMVGVSCTHLGGKSSGTPLLDNYEEAHKYLWETCKDVLPYRVSR